MDFGGFKRRVHFGRYGNLQAHHEPGPGEPAVPQLGRRREYLAVSFGIGWNLVGRWGDFGHEFGGHQVFLLFIQCTNFLA